MDSQTVVEKIVQNLSFEVEAVPKNKTVELSSSSATTPLNVKIRVRKKDDLTMRHGVISIPKFDDPEMVPQKIRLVNSDQTIMSFDVFMEGEFEKKPLRKPRKHLFDILKPGICLGASNDDDDYPHMPSSSYSANVTEGNTISRSDRVLKHNFTLSKNTYEYSDPAKDKTFLGKCKPGGCLDPPFGEDKYSYKPVSQELLPIEENTVKEGRGQDSDAKCKGRRSSVFDSGIFKKKRKRSELSTGTTGSNSIKENHSNSILNLYQVESTVNSLSTTQSNSIITYPPALTSSELTNADEKNRSRLSSEDKSRKSNNEFTDAYFIPPKGINKIRDKKKDTNIETDELQEYDKEKRKSKPIETIKIPIPIPVPITIKPESVKYETVAVNIEKPNVGDIDSKLNDSPILLGNENTIDKEKVSNPDHSQQEKERIKSFIDDSNAMEAKFVTIDDFDKISKGVHSDNALKVKNSPLVVINPQKSLKLEGQISPTKNAVIGELHLEKIPQTRVKQYLNEHEITEIIIPPKIGVKHIDIVEKTDEAYSSEDNKQEEQVSLANNASIEELHSKEKPQNTLKESLNAPEIIISPKEDVGIIDIVENTIETNSNEGNKQDGLVSSSKNGSIKELNSEEKPQNTLKQDLNVHEISESLILSKEDVVIIDTVDNIKQTFSIEGNKLDGLVSPAKKVSIKELNSEEKPQNTLKQDLNVHEISERLILPKEDVEIIDTVENTIETNSNEGKELDGLVLPAKNHSIKELHSEEKPQNTLKQDLNVHEISERIIQPKEDVGIIDTVENIKNTFSIEGHKLDGLVSPAKNGSIKELNSEEKPQNSLTQDLNIRKLSERVILPKEAIEIIDIGENTKETCTIEGDSLQSTVSSLQANTLDTPFDTSQEADFTEKSNQHKQTTESINENVDLHSSQREFSRKPPSFSEPAILQHQDVNFDKSGVYENKEKTMLHPTIIEDRHIKAIENKIDSSQSDNNREISKSNSNADGDILSADRTSQITWSIKNDSHIIDQVQSLKDIEKIEPSTDELISGNRSYTTPQATTDTDFRKLGSVDSETNLVTKYSDDDVNQEPYKEDVNHWKAALRTKNTNSVNDYDSSASTSIIKSTKDKGLMSPEKGVVLPMFNTVSTETLSKSDDIPSEPEVPNNELDKSFSNVGKRYLGSATVSSSIPSTSTLKSVLKKETVAVDLAFQSYLNDKNERILKTMDTTTEPKRYLNDAITLVKSQVRLSANEIRIPIDSENDMFIHIKKASVNQHVHISECELETGTKHDMKPSDTQLQQEIIDREMLHDTLLEIYDQELVPLQMVIKNLKNEIDVLASQQTVFKEKVFNTKKSKPARIVHTNKRCGCLKKI